MKTLQTEKPNLDQSIRLYTSLGQLPTLLEGMSVESNDGTITLTQEALDYIGATTQKQKDVVNKIFNDSVGGILNTFHCTMFMIMLLHKTLPVDDVISMIDE